MLGSPFSTSECVIDIITNVRRKKKNRKKDWKTGGIDVRHFGNFWKVFGFKFCWEPEGNWVFHPHTFYISLRRDWPRLLGWTEANPISWITEWLPAEKCPDQRQRHTPVTFFFLAVCGKFVAFFRMLIGAKMAIPYILVSFVASYGLILCIRHTIVPVDKVFWVKLKKLEGKGKGFRVGPCTSAAVQKSQQTRGNGLDAGSVLHCNLYNGVVVKYEFIDILFLFSGRHQENVKLLKFHLISLNLFNSKFMRIRKWIEVASYLIFF